MISQKLVHLIESHAEELAERWLKDVLVHTDTPTYRTLPEEKLRQRACYVYAHLGRWVGREDHREEVEQDYRELGAERFAEGFRLSEVIAALMLTKKQLWGYVLDQGFFDSAVQLYQTLELYNNVVLYFDRAAVFTSRGYEDAAREKLRLTA
jgi:hypothetical protein